MKLNVVTVTLLDKPNTKEILMVEKIVAFTPMQQGCMIRTVNGTFLVAQTFEQLATQIERL